MNMTEINVEELIGREIAKFSLNKDAIYNITEIQAIMFSTAFYIQGVRADNSRNQNLVWTYIIDSRYWLDIALSRKQFRTVSVEKRRAVSCKRVAAAKIKNERYQPHIDFVMNAYSTGVWKDKSDAADKIEPLLAKHIKEDALWPLMESNMREWIYKKLTNKK